MKSQFDIDIENLISSSLKKTSDALLRQAEDLRRRPQRKNLASARPLRELQMQLSQILQLPAPGMDKFLPFFISLYIDDIFSNLLTETPYNERVRIFREELFTEIGKLLKELSEVYQKGRKSMVFGVYKKLVNAYLKKIDKLNS